jgi:hypothetical protein
MRIGESKQFCHRGRLRPSGITGPLPKWNRGPPPLGSARGSRAPIPRKRIAIRHAEPPTKNVRILPPISRLFVRSRSLRPDSVKTYENPARGVACRNTDELPAPVSAALIGRLTPLLENGWGSPHTWVALPQRPHSRNPVRKRVLELNKRVRRIAGWAWHAVLWGLIRGLAWKIPEVPRARSLRHRPQR